MPEITVIIPVYNSQKFLLSCIKSVLSQTFIDFELILVDDGSTDDSGKMCQEVALRDSRVRVFHKENGGQSTARNLGLDQAKGTYITFIDSDDYVAENYLELLYRLIKKYEVDIVSSKLAVEGDSALISTGKVLQFSDKTELMAAYLNENPFLWGPVAKLFKREFLGNIRFVEGVVHEDDWFNYRLFAKARRAVYQDEVTYYYVQHPESTTNQPFSLQRLDWIIEAHKILEDVKESYPSLFSTEARNLALRYYWLYMQMFIEKSSRSNLQALKRLYAQDKHYFQANDKISKKVKVLLFSASQFPVLTGLIYRTLRKVR